MGRELQGGGCSGFPRFCWQTSPPPTHETFFPPLKGGLQRQVNWVDLSLLLWWVKKVWGLLSDLRKIREAGLGLPGFCWRTSWRSLNRSSVGVRSGNLHLLLSCLLACLVSFFFSWGRGSKSQVALLGPLGSYLLSVPLKIPPFKEGTASLRWLSGELFWRLARQFVLNPHRFNLVF